MTLRKQTIVAACAALFVLAVPATAQITPSKESLSRLSGRATRPMHNGASPADRSGATRTCTPALSVDAGLFGDRLGLEEAYRFARGEEVIVLDRPAGEARPSARLAGDRRPLRRAWG